MTEAEINHILKIAGTRDFENCTKEELIEILEMWDIRNYSKEDLFQYLDENEGCKVVEKTELRSIMLGMLREMRGMCVGNTVYFTDRQIDTMIKIYAGEEE